MSAKGGGDKRYIPPGSCTWCGHTPHAASSCRMTITTKDSTAAQCRCQKETIA